MGLLLELPVTHLYWVNRTGVPSAHRKVLYWDIMDFLLTCDRKVPLNACHSAGT